MGPVRSSTFALADVDADDEKPSTPLSVCRELALQIVQDLPARLMARDTLPKMCHLVMDGSANVQRMAHQLLQKAAKKYTEELIIEAAIDTEGAVKSELPTELLDILQRNLNHEETAEFGQVRTIPLSGLPCMLTPNTPGMVRLPVGLDGDIRSVCRRSM